MQNDYSFQAFNIIYISTKKKLQKYVYILCFILKIKRLIFEYRPKVNLNGNK